MTFFYCILENILVRGSIWNGPCKAGITSHLSQCSFHTLLADIGSIGVGFRYAFGELGGELGAIIAIGVAGLPTLGAMLNVGLQQYFWCQPKFYHKSCLIFKKLINLFDIAMILPTVGGIGCESKY